MPWNVRFFCLVAKSCLSLTGHPPMYGAAEFPIEGDKPMF